MNVREALRNRADLFEKIGHYSLLERIVLKHGKDGAAFKHQLGKGEVRACFMNATHLVIADRHLRYCEGFAMKETLALPLQHAWVLDGMDNVIDTTWDYEPGTTYLGIVFSHKQLCDLMRHQKVYGLFDTGIMLNVPLLETIDTAMVSEAKNFNKRRVA